MSDLVFRKLRLENFKSFVGKHEFNIDRPAGLYFITGSNKLEPDLGANGIGKSSLWDALLWCLWGRTGRDNRPSTAIQPWGSNGTTNVQVELERNGTPFYIARTRNPNHLEVSDGKRGVQEIVQEDVPKLLGMSEELFRRSLLFSQSGRLFLDLRPEEQAQMFTDALNLQVWLQASKLASVSASMAAQEVAGLENKLKTNEAQRQDIADWINKEKERSAQFESEKAERLAEFQKKFEEAERHLASCAVVDRPTKPERSSKVAELQDELEKVRSSIAVLGQDIAIQKNDLIKTNQSFADLKANKPCPECGQKMLPELVRRRTLELAKRADAMATIAAQAKTEAAALSSRRKTLSDELLQEEELYDKAVTRYDRRMQDYATWGATRASRQGARDVAARRLKECKEQTNEAEVRLTELRQQRSNLREVASTLKAELADTQSQLADNQFWVEGFREIRLEIIDQVLIELEMAASRHAAMLGLQDWGIKFSTEKENKSGSVTLAFSVLLYPPDQDKPVRWESYSGGESQRWQLAVSFALSEVLLARAGLTPNVEIYDEPTKGLSPDGIADLLEHLRTRADDLDRVIYFVDHHSLDRGDFQGTLFIEKGKKGSHMKWL